MFSHSADVTVIHRSNVEEALLWTHALTKLGTADLFDFSKLGMREALQKYLMHNCNEKIIFSPSITAKDNL